MYHYGLSLRKCKIIVSSFEDISHESIRKWYHKTDTIFSVGKCYRETVAVDETKFKINGRRDILWAAIEYTKLGNTWCLGNQIFILIHRIKLFYRN
jgi:transposase-like protein